MDEAENPSDPSTTEEINPENVQQDKSDNGDSTGSGQLTQVPVIQVESIE